jgi:TetR/AcrR family transcriptional regulator, cholesterol catabolism regulator
MRKSVKVVKPEMDIRYREIMLVAARIIARQGYNGTTIEDIASELGLTPAAIYYYFKSKADLLHHIAVDLPEPIDNILRINEYHLPPRDQLKQVIIWLITFHTQYPEFSVISSESRRFLPKEVSEIILRRHKQAQQIIKDILEKGVEQGIFAVEDVQMAAFTLLGACNWVYRWHKPNGRLKPSQIADKFVSFLEKGYLNTDSRLTGYVIHSGDDNIYPSEVEEVY